MLSPVGFEKRQRKLIKADVWETSGISNTSPQLHIIDSYCDAPPHDYHTLHLTVYFGIKT